MAQIGAILVFCSSCKILYFANSVHPRIATEQGGIALASTVGCLQFHIIMLLNFCGISEVIKVESESLF